MYDLVGQSWFVTGASTGFGMMITQEVLRRGGNVVATARDPAAVDRLIGLAPTRALAARLDVTSLDDIDTAVSAALARFGRIDVLVNSAGFGHVGAIEETSDAEIRKLFDVNVFGLSNVTRAILPHMRKAGSGIVINLSSMAGIRASAFAGFYSASKFAVEAISEALAKEAAELGISVLVVEPGAFRTDFAGRSLTTSSTNITDYKAAARTRTMVKAMDGRQSGDPIRAARLIVDQAIATDRPLRLVLGADAYREIVLALETKLADIHRSRDLAPAADFASHD